MRFLWRFVFPVLGVLALVALVASFALEFVLARQWEAVGAGDARTRSQEIGRTASPSGGVELVDVAWALGLIDALQGDWRYPREFYLSARGASFEAGEFVAGFTIGHEGMPFQRDEPVTGFVDVKWTSDSLVQVRYCAVAFHELANLTSVERADGQFADIELELVRMPECRITHSSQDVLSASWE